MYKGGNPQERVKEKYYLMATKDLRSTSYATVKEGHGLHHRACFRDLICGSPNINIRSPLSPATTGCTRDRLTHHEATSTTREFGQISAIAPAPTPTILTSLPYS